MAELILLFLSLLSTKVCYAIPKFTPRHGIGFPYPPPGPYFIPPPLTSKHLPPYPYFNKPHAPFLLHPLMHLWNGWKPQTGLRFAGSLTQLLGMLKRNPLRFAKDAA